MSLGLAAIGGFVNRRKEVIDSQRAAAQKMAETEHRIDLETQGRIKAQTTIDKAKLDAEIGNRREIIHQLAVQYKRNNPSTEASVADIAAIFGGYGTNDASLNDLKKRIHEGHVRMGQSGMSFRTLPTPEKFAVSEKELDIALTFLEDSGEESPLILGIANAGNISPDEAKSQLNDLKPHARVLIGNQIAQMAGMKAGSNIYGDTKVQHSFGRRLGSELVRDPSTFFGLVSGDVGLRMPSQPPGHRQVGYTGNARESKQPFPKPGERVFPRNSQGVVIGEPFDYTGKGADPHNLMDRLNWEDPKTRKPPTPTQMRSRA